MIDSTVSECALHTIFYLKGQCHEIFCFKFFSWIIFPQAPKNNIRVISNFFENLRRYRKSRCPTGINTTGGKFAAGVNYTGINDTRGKFATGTSGVTIENGGKLPPPVLTTPAVNLTSVTMGTISVFLHLEVNKKTKIYLYVKSTTQRCPNKIFKTFLIEDFFICHWWCNITENIERVSIYHSRICSIYNKPSRSCWI